MMGHPAGSSNEDPAQLPSKEELGRWAENVHCLLIDRKGFDHFNNFLTTCDIQNSLQALKLWRMCSDSLDRFSTDRSPPDDDLSENIHKEATDLFNFAKDVPGLYAEDTNYLHTVAQSPNLQHMRKALEKLMITAASRLLTMPYNKFMEHIVKDYKHRSKRKWKCNIF